MLDQVVKSTVISERIKVLASLLTHSPTTDVVAELQTLADFAAAALGVMSKPRLWGSGVTIVPGDKSSEFAEGLATANLPGWVRNNIDWDEASTELMSGWDTFEHEDDTYFIVPTDSVPQ